MCASVTAFGTPQLGLYVEYGWTTVHVCLGPAANPGCLLSSDCLSRDLELSRDLAQEKAIKEALCQQAKPASALPAAVKP